MTLIEKLNELISGIQIAMLTTVHSNDHLQSRPMATQPISGDGSLWFFTKQHSSKIDGIRNDHQVNVAFADPANMRFVSISGTCELVRNREIAQDLWKPEYGRWFSHGIDESDLILLKVTINSAEYWDSQTGEMQPVEAQHQTMVLRDERTTAV